MLWDFHWSRSSIPSSLNILFTFGYAPKKMCRPVSTQSPSLSCHAETLPPKTSRACVPQRGAQSKHKNVVHSTRWSNAYNPVDPIRQSRPAHQIQRPSKELYAWAQDKLTSRTTGLCPASDRYLAQDSPASPAPMTATFNGRSGLGESTNDCDSAAASRWFSEVSSSGGRG